MKALSKIFLPFIATLALAGCGGGSGGSSGAAFEPPMDLVTVSAASTSITTDNYTTLIVSVKKQDGTAEADGTSISASVSPASLGSISGGTGAAGASATSALSGGTTTFIFNSATNTGTATVNISVPPVGGNPNSITTSVNIAITPGNGINPLLQLVATATTLPVSPYSFGQQQTSPFPGNFLGSPYIAEIAVTWRHSSGQLVSGTLPVNVSIAPTTVAGFSTLDSTTTTTGTDQFHTILGSGPVNVTGGVGTIYVHASNIPGTAVLTVTATDPDHAGLTISSQLTITVAGATSNNLPGAVSISQAAGGVYISAPPQSKLVSATVTDGNGALIANPTDGPNTAWDNVQFQIVGPAGTDATLSGVNAAGVSQQNATTILTRTFNGVASVTFQAGTQQGPVQVKATVDRGDNNVDNGIQDPISATASVIVSDGKLYSLTLASPGTNAILVNSAVSTSTAPSAIPTNPDATYSFTVSAIGTDRQGNPVVPGTVLNFGSIDTPQSNSAFSISGTQGDPQEGGTGFSANDGHFVSAGGGAGPHDTLLVIGKQSEGAPAGNDDLESALTVASVQSNTHLTVASPFNLNDTTGASVNHGAVLPYVVGRATIGNISSPASTNSVGVATTTLNYPVSALGKIAGIWVQGTGIDTVTNGTRSVTDVAIVAFPGVAPAKIVISPNPIPGDITIGVQVCIYDAVSSPLQGVVFNFAFANLGIGSGSVDGVSTAGNTANATDATGCVITTVKTNGLDSTSTATLTFSAAGATATAPITASGNLILLASPSSFTNGLGGTVTLTLLNGNGTPVPGVQLVGSCTGDPSVGITSGPGVTGPNGTTTASITANLNGPATTKTGSCTFTTSTGSPSATVTLSGIDTCLTSPGCGP